jgi:6-phosphogluconolactonase
MSRCLSRFSCFVAALLFVIPGVEAFGAEAKPGSTLVYIGTYTGKKSQGIYVLHLDPATGALSAPQLAGEMANPSWVTLHPNHKFLYAVGESSPAQGGPKVAGFAIQADGTLKALNSQSAAGSGPCHVTIDATGKNALVANYNSGNVADFPVAEDGMLAAPSSTDQHHGADPKQKPHAHYIDVDSTNHYVLCCDAGLDRVYVYRFDAANHTLAPNDPPFAATEPQTNPRHLAFTPNGKFAYTINEHSLTVTAFTYDAEHGVLHEIQSIDTQPAGAPTKGHSTAELICHPSGKFLYGSNRGDDSIVAYKIDPETGKLTLISHTPSGGKTPRGFGIDPTGNWLIAGNQGSDTLVEFHIDTATGQLKATGTSYELGAPVCVKFLETGK